MDGRSLVEGDGTLTEGAALVVAWWGKSPPAFGDAFRDLAARIDAALAQREADVRAEERGRLAGIAARIYCDDEIGKDIAAAILAEPTVERGTGESDG